ncbi:uncharacterized protein [Cherax quadricarinatus]|uniref:uncharacterized protein n=1 Tax=Cherax quadricarinatus TaxID=27406 RepID=UPI00387E448F
MTRTIVLSSFLLVSVLVSAQEDQNLAPEPRIWSPGRITQVTLAVVESTLLTLMLVFPQVMDPIVAFINQHVGSSGSRRRRELRTLVSEQAGTIHKLILEAIDQFEDLDASISMVTQ